MPRGKRQRPAPDAATVERLRKLLEVRRRADSDATRAMDELFTAAAEACDVKGLSVRQVADALEVGSTTVQGWVVRGRVLRGSPE